jgi:hypothetical protein
MEVKGLRLTVKLGTKEKRVRLRSLLHVLRVVRGRMLAFTALVLIAGVGSFVWFRSQASAACECNLFTTPTGQTLFQEGAALELGVKFIPAVDGTITGIRYYKQGSMSGTHVGRLWNNGSGPEIKSATFQSETASGWQSVTFDTPVTVTAGTTYVASVSFMDGRYIASTNYFTSNVTNGPLTAPSSASSGGNGVFNGSAGSYPNNTSNSANYWVDVSFYASDPPVVSSVTPTDAATNIEPGDTVKATFDMSMDPTTFNSSTFTVKDPSQNAVAATYSYDDATKTASFVANEGFSPNTTYTATLEGGTGSTVNNLAGIPLASDYTWSFTTAAAAQCPCSLKDRAAPVNAGTADDLGSTELGVKIKATTNGYITALRFYKPITSTQTTHTGKVWSSTGTQLATVTFSNESDYGWQEAKLSSPLRVNENQVYVVSYGASDAIYAYTANALTGQNITSGYMTAYANSSSENAATGSGNGNGVFTTTAGSYPSSASPNGSYYWVDAVFSLTSNPSNPLTVGVTQPKSDAYGVQRDQVVTAKFNRNIDGATITNSTFQVFNSSNSQIAGTATYDVAKGEATFTPGSQLTAGQRYTAKLAASVADTDGTTLGSEYSWSFTVGSAVSTDPLAAPGGPILAITNSGSPTSPYYTEILRTEGLNYYDTKDITQVDAATLANYKVAVLAEMSLSQPQVDTLTAWVNNGGNLIAMRPDSKLAGLLGLTSAGTTRANQYMLIDTASGPGEGIVSESMQFKGTADNYSLNGATAIATLYSNANTATSNPAVTTKSVGSNGGTAVAFTYDLAKSVIMMHQGNQSWVGQNRDGNSPARANDLFYGNMVGDVQPDWVDPDKFHIPQADEQQRLFANIITEAARDKQPMPRFWYLPGSNKAALLMAGDDHGLNNNTGTEMIINNFLNNSATNCSVIDWECDRTSHYVYESASLTNARATQYVGYKFEIGDHISTTCNAFASYAALSAIYTADLNTWRAKYTTVPNQKTHRYHCYVWSDWDSQARVEAANDMRYDLNYVAFPGTWVGTKAPIMTGSAMNMRFTDTTGTMIDVRQGVTNLDDQSTNATNVNALIDNAVGSTGYYGIYGTHYDMSNSFDKTLIASAQSRDVAMISAEQALTWLDGRNSSTFSSFTGDNGQYGFTIAAAEGATGLRAMLPIANEGGTLDELTLGGNDVTYQTQTIKGEQYAVFNANPGAYTATYTDYDPNAGNGGNNGGNNDGNSGGSSGSSGSGSTSGSTGSSSAAGRGANSDTTAESTEGDGILPDEATGDEQTNTDSPSTGGWNTDDSDESSENTSGSGDTGFIPWIIGGFVVVVALLGGWWFLAWRRRHADTSSPY